MSITHYYYTNKVTEKANVTDATSDSNNATANLLSQNLDTKWEPATTTENGGKPYVVLDLGPNQTDATYNAGRGVASGSFDTIGLWIKNYGTDFTQTGLNLYSGFASICPIHHGYYSIDHDGSPIWYASVSGSAIARRYVRIEFDNLPTPIQVSHLFLSTERSIGRSHEYNGSYKKPLYSNMSNSLNGGHTSVHYQTHDAVQQFRRQYEIITQSEITSVENIWEDCAGSRRLFIYQPSTGFGDAYVCRFDKDAPNWKEVHAEYWQVQFDFTQLPYIRPGETY